TLLVSEGKKIVFMWVPSQMGIRGNIAVDKSAKEALRLDFPSAVFQFVRYYDPSCMTSFYCKRLWSNQINNKLFQILPDLSASLPNFASTRKEKTV
ncbi:hypothetical protein, partial [Acinetobacter baumannii]|uniref:hypothetical protein n=1 Tax=Acinetobacter baumannii TaxID=470 RepID=UPI003395B54F